MNISRNVRKTNILASALVVILFLPNPAVSSDETALPAESQQLIERLEEWESAEREEFEKMVQAKTAEVVTLLETQLTATTKKGDLDGALAIRRKIEELNAKLLPNTGQQLAAWLAARKIEFKAKSGKHVIKFESDNSALLFFKSEPGQKITYKALSDRHVELRWGKTNYRLEYSKDMKTGVFVSPAGKYPVSTSLDE